MGFINIYLSYHLNGGMIGSQWSQITWMTLVRLFPLMGATCRGNLETISNTEKHVLTHLTEI